MSISQPAKIQLTPEEDELLNAVDFDLSQSDRESRVACIEAAGPLTESLLKRGAIPEIRRRYLTDVELNIMNFWPEMALALLAAILTTRFGFAWGDWMRDVRR